jgi:hypothetical protein
MAAELSPPIDAGGHTFDARFDFAAAVFPLSDGKSTQLGKARLWFVELVVMHQQRVDLDISGKNRSVAGQDTPAGCGQVFYLRQRREHPLPRVITGGDFQLQTAGKDEARENQVQ